jgi:hypothetical protein
MVEILPDAGIEILLPLRRLMAAVDDEQRRAATDQGTALNQVHRLFVGLVGKNDADIAVPDVCRRRTAAAHRQ